MKKMLVRIRKLLVCFVAAACGFYARLCIPPASKNQDAMPAVTNTEIADPLEKYLRERNDWLQKQVSELNGMIHNADTDEEIASMARRRLIKLLEQASLQVDLEGALNLMDFEGAAVQVQEEFVIVFVRTDALTQQQTAVIFDMVRAETGFSDGNVKIIPIN